METIDVVKLAEELESKSAEEVVKWALDTFGEKVGLANSFGAEDVVLTHIIAKINPNAVIFTLDTGRINEETYKVWDELRTKYGVHIKAYCPDGPSAEKMMNENGPNLFYRSIEDRKLCCKTRKLEPLGRALSELEAWICGLRREQAVTRGDIKKIEMSNGMIKLNPLADWSEEQVWNFIKENDIPYNKLHDQKFPSIGCAPCTRAVKEGEDVRAGRWWWEAPEQKECGLHCAK